MKTAIQIKDEYALTEGYASWEDMYQRSFIFHSRVEEVMKLYALEAIKADRLKVAENALVDYFLEGGNNFDGGYTCCHSVDQDSIINAPLPDLL